MKFSHKRAISPIIATLLLIAIAVAAGIIVYVYVNSLAGGLTSGGGGQVSTQLQLQAYTFTGISGTSASSNGVILDAFLENTGSSSLTISAVYLDGTALTQWYTTGGAYEQYFQVPGSGGNCFALLTSSPTVVAYTTTVSGGSATSGTTSACGSNSVTNTNGAVCQTVICFNAVTGETPDATLSPQTGTVQLVVGLNTAATSGTSHTIKIVSATGGVSIFTVVAGRTG